MMQLIENHSPKVYYHRCKGYETGTIMGLGEQRRFMTEILADSFKECGSNVSVVKHRDDEYFPDLRIEDSLGKGTFTTDFVVIPSLTTLNDEQIEKLRDLYDGSDIVVKILKGKLWCVDNYGNVPLMGSSFTTTFEPTTIYPVIENEELTENLSQHDLVGKVIESWATLDSSIMEPYFDKDMHFKADWIFYEISSSYEYTTYIRQTFNRIQAEGSHPEVAIGKNMKTGDLAMLIRQTEKKSDTVIMQIDTRDGRITNMHMMKMPDYKIPKI